MVFFVKIVKIAFWGDTLKDIAAMIIRKADRWLRKGSGKVCMESPIFTPRNFFRISEYLISKFPKFCQSRILGLGHFPTFTRSNGHPSLLIDLIDLISPIHSKLRWTQILDCLSKAEVPRKDFGSLSNTQLSEPLSKTRLPSSQRLSVLAKTQLPLKDLTSFL